MEYNLLLWGLGISWAGFLFLIGWIFKLNTDLEKKVSYSWIEKKFDEEVKKELGQIVKSIGEIRDAVVGTVERRGIITKIHDHEKRLNEIENNI